MTPVRRLLREPLLHFFVIGGLFFLAFDRMSGPAPAPADTIVVGPEAVQRLSAGYQSVWKRPPSEEEIRALVDDYVREEIYYREALALGLDRDDVVVRRRLRQKMEFLTDSGANLLAPAAGELEAFFAANRQSYRRDPRLAFAQVYLGEAPTEPAITQALKALRSEPAADPYALGTSTLLPAELGLSPPAAIDGLFGTGFFERLAAFPPGEWSGPVASGYGVHLVRILDREPGQAPPLAEISGAVLRDWKAAKALELRDAQYARLRQRYAVQILDGAVRTADPQ